MMRKLAAVVIVAAAFVVAGSAHSQASVNALFIVTAPKTEILIGAERIATRGCGSHHRDGGRGSAHRQRTAHAHLA